MSGMIIGVGSAVCHPFSAIGVAGSCHNPDAMMVLGTISLFLVMIGLGVRVLRHQ